MKTKKSNAQMGLETKSFPKNKKWMVDQDYTNELSAEEKEWLGRFNQEYYRNRFESEEKDLHNTAELKRSCYSNENARNRDLYAIKDVGGAMVSITNSNDDEEFNYDAVDYDMGYALVDYKQEQQSKKLKKAK